MMRQLPLRPTRASRLSPLAHFVAFLRGWCGEALAHPEQSTSRRLLTQRSPTSRARLAPWGLTLALALTPTLGGCEGALGGSPQGTTQKYSSSIPSVGVAACDDYIAQYESCVISQLPSWQQNQALTGLQKTRNQWAAQADSPFKQEALGRVCAHATEAAELEYTSWSCGGS